VKLSWLRDGRARTRWLAALAAAAAVAWVLAQMLKASLPLRIAAAGAAVVIPILLTELITEVFQQDDERTMVCVKNLRLYHRRKGVPKVGTLQDSELETLGVSQSRRSGSWRHELSRYVPRDKDSELDALLDDQAFVLLIGDSKVGKSRMAAEAIRRKFRDRALIIPDNAGSLPALLDVGLDFENSVVWLDDLQRYLENTGLGRLLDSLAGSDAPRNVTILATIREKAYAPYMPGGDLESGYWPVLQRASKLRIARLLSAAERERTAATFEDPDLLAALDRYGLAEYLSAGPDLVERLTNGYTTQPVGAMIVMAATDWSRTGLNRPVPQPVLVALVENYADRLPPQPTGPSDIGNALAWAQKPVYGASQLLSSGPAGFTVFDYVLDSATEAIPDGVWDAALATAHGAEFVQVGIAAHDQNRLDIAVRAFEIAVRVDTPLVDTTLAAYNYALILEQMDKRSGAEEYYRKAADAGHVEAACAAGRLLEARGETAQAERYYHVAAEAGSPEGAFTLAKLLRESQPDEALRRLDQAALAGHVEAACEAGRLLEARGDTADAERYYKLAAKAGSPEAAFALGMLRRERDPGEALRWLDQAALAGHVEAAYAASRLLEARGQPGEAERYRRMAASAGQRDRSQLEAQRPRVTVRLVGQALRTAEAIVDRAGLLETQMAGYSEAELAQRTTSFRRRLQHGETLDDLAPEAFAVAREAASRVCQLRCHDVQLAGAAALHLGYVAEMRRGEGGAVSAMLAAYLNALSGDPVHVITADEAAARRDAAEMGDIYRFLGVDTGVIVSEMLDEARQVAYGAAITYSCIDQLTLDYLRDNMRRPDDPPTQRGTHFAIVDEADLLMIDRATDECNITTAEDRPSHWYRNIAPLARRLQRDVHYTVDDRARRIDLTEAGIVAIEDSLGIDNLYVPANVYLVPYVDGALQAKELYRRGEQYIVSEGEILLMDPTTGATRPNLRYSGGLHQSLEAKEGVLVRPDSTAAARMHQWAYLKMYKKLAGLSGTAAVDADTFRQLYALDVVEIPTNKPHSLVRHNDIVFNSDAGRWAAVADMVEDHHGTGQPVLVDVTSNERADALSEILSARGIPHQLLTTRSHRSSDEAVADAGRKGAVTVGTNLYQSLVDIPLGGREATPADHEDVVALGGLMVIGSERRTSRRKDDRLCDLTAHRGESGECQFTISKGDSLASSVRWWAPISLAGDVPLSSPMISRALRSLQKTLGDVERAALLLELGHLRVFEDKRAAIYALRGKATTGDNIDDLARGYLHEVIDSYLASYSQGLGRRHRDIEGLRTSMVRLVGSGFNVAALEAGTAAGRILARTRSRGMASALHAAAQRAWDDRAASLGLDVWMQLERFVLSAVIDRRWPEYLSDLDELRQVARMARFKGTDPLMEYRAGADSEFEKLEHAIKEEVAGNLMNLQVTIADDPADSVADGPVSATSVVPAVAAPRPAQIVNAGNATSGGAAAQIDAAADQG
jgi:preprotein translocase subunit SecA